MRIVDVKESGSNNVLRWAIRNKIGMFDENGDPNIPLINVINDETFYLVTIANVTLYELFRLTQLYRNKLRIVDYEVPAVPSEEFLRNRFHGDVGVETALAAINRFTSIATQMISDNDIIHESGIQLIHPMITRLYEVQIPMAFADAVTVMSPRECSKLFTIEYPNTLDSILAEPKDNEIPHGFTKLMLKVVQSTNNIKYDEGYEALIRETKYFALNPPPGQVYDVRLIGFSKYDPITKGEIKCNLFKADKETTAAAIKKMSKISSQSPLELEFAIQLPIGIMQVLEHSYFPEDLRIAYRSSINNILDNGMVFEDFKTLDVDHSISMNEDGYEDRVKERDNAISAYKVRLADANHQMLQSMAALIQDGESHPSSISSLLPAGYRANAVVTLAYNDLPRFREHVNPMLEEVFTTMQKFGDSIYRNIS